MNYIKTDTETAVLGSGELYAAVYDSAVDYDTLATEDMVCLGYIKEAAELKTALERAELESANRGTVATLVKKKVVEFSTGIFSYNLENVSKFLTGSKYEEADGKRTFYFGDADATPQVVLRFIAIDETNNKKITVNMFRCQWQGDFTLNFNNDDPIEHDYSFKVLSAKMPNGKLGYFSVVEEDLVAEGAA